MGNEVQLTYDESMMRSMMNSIMGLKPTKEDLNDIAFEYINLFKDAFANKAWNGNAWKPTRDGKTAILVQSGKLRNSFEIQDIDDDSFTIISDLPYSKIHNEGGKIKITEKMRSFFWAKYSQTGNPKWKAMALRKKYFTIKQRQFMGEHPDMQNIVENVLKSNRPELFK